MKTPTLNLEMGINSTSKWKISRNLKKKKNFIVDALCWNKKNNFDLLCVEEVVKTKQGSLILFLS